MVKQRFIRNGVVFDPNIYDDPFGAEESSPAKKQYLKGKGKRVPYFGV